MKAKRKHKISLIILNFFLQIPFLALGFWRRCIHFLYRNYRLLHFDQPARSEINITIELSQQLMHSHFFQLLRNKI